MSDQMSSLVEAPLEFLKEGLQFSRRCEKPDRKEFIKICTAVGTGFVVMGVVGYFVKLIHIPLNHTLVGGA